MFIGTQPISLYIVQGCFRTTTTEFEQLQLTKQYDPQNLKYLSFDSLPEKVCRPLV